MKRSCSNHPVVVWCTCLLWILSIFAITWSLLLFVCVNDMLVLTGLDLVTALVLLLGIMLLPANVQMLLAISAGQRIQYDTKVIGCSLWLSVVWIITVSVVGVVLCSQRLSHCRATTDEVFAGGMKMYRSSARHKRFVDNLQWNLKCCGLQSFRDWFTCNWYDKIRDYEWDPAGNRRSPRESQDKKFTDSVPLSCCKSGSCINNYLSELGTSYINTEGCSNPTYLSVRWLLMAHLTLFTVVIILKLILLYLVKTNTGCCKCEQNSNKSWYDVRHIMVAKQDFRTSSASCHLNPDDDDTDETDDAAREYEQGNFENDSLMEVHELSKITDIDKTLQN